MKRWDVFISHASEDKVSVALPLAKALKVGGVRVWLDKQELRVGDSLREKIDEGLAQSSFGVVILSPSFLAKHWPKRELDGLFSREEEGRKVILPVWHEIDKTTLNQFSPILSSKLAVSTSVGIAQMTSELIEAIFDPASDVAPSVARRLIDLLDGDADRTSIRGFLAAHPNVVREAFGFFSDAPIVWSPTFAEFTPDLCVGLLQKSIRRMEWTVVVLESASTSLLEASMTPLPVLADSVRKLETFRNWLGSNLAQARQVVPDIGPEFRGVVVAGRRKTLSPSETEFLREYNDYLLGTRVRTYDWLIEAAATLE